MVSVTAAAVGHRRLGVSGSAVDRSCGTAGVRSVLVVLVSLRGGARTRFVRASVRPTAAGHAARFAITGVRLAPGRYRIAAVATDAAGRTNVPDLAGAPTVTMPH